MENSLPLTTISFFIEALDQLESHPHFSYEFLFKAFDCFAECYAGPTSITDKIKSFCDNEWNNITNSNTDLKNAFNSLFSSIPVRACQYLYLRITNHGGDNQPYKRVTSDISGRISPESDARKEIIDAIENKYGVDKDNYSDTIRKASTLYRYILKNDSVNIDKLYTINTKDRLHILVSGLFYTLRNDIMHGSSIDITKSSKTSIATYAINFYSFLFLYYLIVILIINKYSNDYSSTVYDELANNICTNVDLFKKLFGGSIGE